MALDDLKHRARDLALEPTSQDQFLDWSRNRVPAVEQVGAGVWSIPVPLGMSGLGYVSVYAFELDDGVALVDAGLDTPEAWAALQAGLGRLGGSVGDVRAVLVTHIHADHYGLAGRIREASGAWVGLHPADAAVAEVRYADMGALIDGLAVSLVEWGAPADVAKALALRPAAFSVRVAPPDVLLVDGDRVDLPGWDLHAVWTPGHSPGHLCFHERTRRLLLSGDHVLPRITPNIAVDPQQRPDPLRDYLDSLARVARLDVSEVLPAHEYRFAELRMRVAELQDHHRTRLAELLAAVEETPGVSAWDLAMAQTWSRPWETLAPLMQCVAVGETLAHLRYLESEGHLYSVGERPLGWRTHHSGSSATGMAMAAS